MPASGKTFVGKRVAAHFGLTFIDPDKIIENEYGLPLQEVLDRLGDKAFIEKESAVTISVSENQKNVLISTGGSIIYSENAMQHLRDIAQIVHLRVPLEVLEARIGSTPRGIVGGRQKDLGQIFKERSVLYEKWATHAVDAHQSVEAVVADITRAVSGSAKVV